VIGPVTDTALADVNTAVVEQVGSSGPNRKKVTKPVGLKPPASVAVSLTAPPRVTGGDVCVLSVGAAGVTTTSSRGSSHAVRARIASASTYSATHR
jgi:hypothetical protein